MLTAEIVGVQVSPACPEPQGTQAQQGSQEQQVKLSSTMNLAMLL